MSNEELHSAITEVLHEEGMTADQEDAMHELYRAEDAAFRQMLRALNEYFMHQCEEGNCQETYEAVYEALGAIIKADNALHGETE